MCLTEFFLGVVKNFLVGQYKCRSFFLPRSPARLNKRFDIYVIDSQNQISLGQMLVSHDRHCNMSTLETIRRFFDEPAAPVTPSPASVDVIHLSPQVIHFVIPHAAKVLYSKYTFKIPSVTYDMSYASADSIGSRHVGGLPLREYRLITSRLILLISLSFVCAAIRESQWMRSDRERDSRTAA